jgi:hypothetical protein
MHDLLSGPRPFGQKGSYKLEYCSVADGGSVDILPTVSGSGLIDFIWIACHYGNQIDMYVDGETNPSISIPAQRFFAAEYVDTQPAFAGPWFSGNGADGGIGVGGFLPIPFST